MTLPTSRVPWILGLLSGLRLLGWWLGASPEGPLGSDPALWGLTALDLQAGNPPLTVPLYPWLMGLLPGQSLSNGLLLSLFSAWLLPLAGWWAAKHFGDRAALWTGILLLVLPDGLVMAFQLQPDAMTSLWAVLLTGSLLRSRWAWIIPLTLVGLLLREHGTPMVPLILLFSLLSRGPRLLRTSTLLLGALIVPSLFGGSVGLDQPWSSRSETAMSLLTTDQKPPHLRQEQWQDFRARGPIKRIQWHTSRSLKEAGDAWGWLALAALLWGTSRRRDLLPAVLPILPTFGALLLWSERRHVAVITPVFVLICAVVLSHSSSKKTLRLGGVTATFLAVWGLLSLPEEARRQRSESAAFGPVQSTAEALCELAEDGDWILSIDQRLILWCPIPQLSDPTHPEAWNAWLVAPAHSVLGPWKPEHTAIKEAWFYRLSSDHLAPPCKSSDPLPRRYLLANGPTPHPAFTQIPMPGSPPVGVPYPETCP